MTVPLRISTMADNGPPPKAAAVLYVGDVMHARLKPFGHRFVYSVFSILADIDRLPEIDRMSRFLSVDRANVASLRTADHIEAGDKTLRGFVDRLLSEAGMKEPATRVLLLCYPRLLGYVFNPISVYFAYDASGDLIALIYAVRNTFGQRHTYVAPIEPGQISDAGVRQARRKLFHVSPFIGMDARYHFRVLPPGRTVRLRIQESEDGEPVLAASFHGEVSPLTSRTLAGALLRFPLMTWKVTAAIHWEALKLWWKGATFHRAPPRPAPASYRDESQRLEAAE